MKAKLSCAILAAAAATPKANAQNLNDALIQKLASVLPAGINRGLSDRNLPCWVSVSYNDLIGSAGPSLQISMTEGVPLSADFIERVIPPTAPSAIFSLYSRNVQNIAVPAVADISDRRSNLIKLRSDRQVPRFANYEGRYRSRYGQIYQHVETDEMSNVIETSQLVRETCTLSLGQGLFSIEGCGQDAANASSKISCHIPIPSSALTKPVINQTTALPDANEEVTGVILSHPHDH